MAHDDSQEQSGEHQGADESSHDTGPITITTTDAAIEAAVEHPSDWKTHPDSTLRVETTQLHEPSPVYATGVRTVVIQDQSSRPGGKPDEGGRSDDRNE